jgi:parallel beta-helix repeat protein
MNKPNVIQYLCRGFFALAIIGSCNALSAATLCVNPGGTNGCYASINAAVAAAAANDTIDVAAGTYSEYVVIDKPLSIIGENRQTTIIEAVGLPNGFNIDGLNNPGLANITITGFTVQNAKFEGIVATNSSFVRIWGNNVVGNDRNLSGNTCPDIPSWETSEDFDCGEGIHLSGVDHATVVSNHVTNNSGGILLSDDTGATHDNLISKNTVQDNPYDCGITLASHPPYQGNSPFGLAHNTIYANVSQRNGTQGEGAGIGIFDSVPGTSNNGNVVVGNTVTNNELPGVAMHGHTPGQSLNDTIIAGNIVVGNGADTDDAFTPGPTGVNLFSVSPATGTIVSQNAIAGEQIAVAVNTPAEVDVNLNGFRTYGLNFGIDNIGTELVNATENWWGCPDGPGSPGCAGINGPNVLFTPWLTSPPSLRLPPRPRVP